MPSDSILPARISEARGLPGCQRFAGWSEVNLVRARAKKPRCIVHLSHLKRWKSVGYRIEILFLRLSSAQIAVRRIATRVRQRGHNVPTEDVLRRFDPRVDEFS